MTEYICKMTLKKLCDNNIIKEEDVEVYHYGLELLIATIFKAIGIMTIAIITGLVKETIVFTLFFSSLRIQAGGYHAKSIIGCFIGMVALIFISVALVERLPVNNQSYYILISIVISMFLVFLYAPLESENKPLSKEEEIIYRRKSLATTFIGSIIILFAIYLNDTFIHLATIAISGFLLESLTLIHIRKDQKST